MNQVEFEEKNIPSRGNYNFLKHFSINAIVWENFLFTCARRISEDYTGGDWRTVSVKFKNNGSNGEFFYCYPKGEGFFTANSFYYSTKATAKVFGMVATITAIEQIYLLLRQRGAPDTALNFYGNLISNIREYAYEILPDEEKEQFFRLTD